MQDIFTVDYDAIFTIFEKFISKNCPYLPPRVRISNTLLTNAPAANQELLVVLQ